MYRGAPIKLEVERRTRLGTELSHLLMGSLPGKSHGKTWSVEEARDGFQKYPDSLVSALEPRCPDNKKSSSTCTVPACEHWGSENMGNVVYLVTARHRDAAPLGNHRKIKCIF